MSLGKLRPGVLFTTAEALDEAHERMSRLGDRTGVTDQARRMLDGVLTPLLTVVPNAPSSGLECESTLAARDADDLPTLRLSLWLGGWLLSDDHDLDAYGAVRDYVPLIRNLGYVISIEFGVDLSARAVWELVKWLASRPWGQFLLIVVVAALGLASRTPAGREARSALYAAGVSVLRFWLEAEQASERLRVTSQ